MNTHLYAFTISFALVFTGALIFSSTSFTVERVEGMGASVHEMTITAYSEKDSCHYRVEGGCLTASQEIADYGTIACPRDWKLGTRVFIESEFFTCSDRYNKNLPDRIDMWVGYGEEAHEIAKSFGVQTLNVEIYE